MVGCAAFQPLPDATPRSIVAHVERGDEVRVRVKDGRVFEFRVSDVGDTQLRGAAPGRTFRIDYSQITSIEVQETSFAHTLASLGVAWLMVSTLATLLFIEAVD